jgi:hypothetical protein
MNPHLLFFLACQLESNSAVPGGNSWQLKVLFSVVTHARVGPPDHVHSPGQPLHDQVTLARLTQRRRRPKSFPWRAKTGALRLYNLVGTMCPISG